MPLFPASADTKSEIPSPLKSSWSIIELKPRILTTAINLEDGTASLELALSVAKNFRLTQEKAKLIIKEIAISVKNWRNIALQFGLQKNETEQMASAFERKELEFANKF